MSTYELFLFLHLLSLVVLFALAGVLHATLFGMRRARTAGELAIWARIGNRVGPLMPIGAIGLFATGAYMLSDRFSWSAAWAAAAIVALVVMEGLGGGVEGPRAKALMRALEGVPADAPVQGELAHHRCDPVTWTVMHLNSALAVGVMILMVTKPGAGGAVAVLVVAALVGAASAVPFWRGAPAPADAEGQAEVLSA